MESLKFEKRIREEFDNLLCLTQTYVLEDVSIHEMEKGLLSQLLQLGLVLLEVVIKEKVKKLKGFMPFSEPGEILESKGLKERKYLSLFGWLEIRRFRHWSQHRKNYYELDERLNFPKAGHWSYNLQELIGEAAAENDFRQSVELINKVLGLNLSGKSSERNVERLGPLVDAFYESQPAEIEASAICFSASFDGKGVPKIKQKKQMDGNPKKRLGKGEKQGIKQMATVSVTSCFVPKVRTRQDIVKSLIGSPLSKVEQDEVAGTATQENDNRWHQKIHRRAFLDDQAKAVEYGLDDIRARMKNPDSRFVVPIDAGIGLEDKVVAYVQKHGLEAQFAGIILDIIHVSEYVWNAATAIFGEKSKVRADWVREMLEDLLDSKTEQVIRHLELIRDKSTLSKGKRKKVNKAITYFTNHQHKMDYKTFIEKGYPVSSALVESACGHLVKQRLEQPGMRWSDQGAQNIMDLRAVKLNNDMETFRNFVIDQEHSACFSKAA